MFDSLIQSIENTFVQFSFRRLLYVVFLLALVLSALYVFNEVTGYSFYQRLDRRISAMERLRALETGGIEQSKELGPLYRSVTSSLREQPRSRVFGGIDAQPLIKFVAASLIPLIFIFVSLANRARGDPSWSDMFVGAIMFTLLFGLPGLFLPTLRSVWVNAGLYLIAQMVLLWLLHVILNRRQKASPATIVSPHG
jgi:hypothetical protein